MESNQISPCGLSKENVNINFSNESLSLRKAKGYQIAKTSRIEESSKGWKVPSQSGKGTYLVVSNGFEATCSCPDHETRQTKCKHIWAVELTVTKEVDNKGNITVIKTLKRTYPQNWKAYNDAQVNEQDFYMKLLRDLCSNIDQPQYEFGRPCLPISDMVFASALKVYSTFSLRRFSSMMKIASEKDYIDNPCSYATISNYMRKEELTPILHDLIAISSSALVTVEEDFAVDSSGFGTSRFARYYSFKHGRDIKYKTWVKAHLISGVKTNIVTGAEITEERKNDSPYFKSLVKKTAEQFSIREVSADKAYSSRENHDLIEEQGGTAYIPFKKNATGRAGRSRAWKRMFHLFELNKEDFMEHYHKRSNSETVFHMIKSKFRDYVRSKDWTAQVNEVLLKVLCHNICVVIQEMHELGINPDFCLRSQADFL